MTLSSFPYQYVIEGSYQPIHAVEIAELLFKRYGRIIVGCYHMGEIYVYYQYEPSREKNHCHKAEGMVFITNGIVYHYNVIMIPIGNNSFPILFNPMFMAAIIQNLLGINVNTRG
jgi:hypothetical protein